MPPKCPKCGRFLSNAFARALLTAPADCPRCDATLTAEQVYGTQALARATGLPVTSVRPPDLPPEVVRPTAEPDVLEGWDRLGAERSDREARQGLLEPLRAGRLRAVTTIAAVGLIGALLGGLLLRRRRLGGLAGTLAGG